MKRNTEEKKKKKERPVKYWMTKLHFGGSEENCEIVKIEAEYFDLQNDELIVF